MPSFDKKENTCICGGCLTVAALRELVRQTVDERVAENAAADAALWDRAFGPEAPKNASAKRDRIITIASSRALLAYIKKPSP